MSALATYHQSVSVLIPNYNGAEHLAATLESCVQQKEWLKEIIVVDDHSTDQSWEILLDWQKRYPQIRPFRNPNKGGNAARNFAFTHASGEFVQWLDSDDQVLPGKWERQISCFAERPDLSVVYSDWRMDFHQKGQVVKQVEHPRKEVDDYLVELLYDRWCPNHCYLLRYSMANELAQMGGWDESYPVHQDTEYILKAAGSGARFGYQKVLACVYNKETGNGTVSQKPLSTRHRYWFQINEMVKKLVRQREDLTAHQRNDYLGLCHTNQLISSFYCQEVHIKEAFSPTLLRISLGSRRLKYLLPFLYLKAMIELAFQKRP